MSEYYLSTEVSVFKEKEFILNLAAGMDAVIRFSKYAGEGIKGAISVETSFGCNVDVQIKGSDLLEFIAEKYPNEEEQARKKIASDEVYTIICYDLS